MDHGERRFLADCENDPVVGREDFYRTLVAVEERPKGIDVCYMVSNLLL